ncbi:MAG TPA: helix-turn-helix domain-containing protein [Gemmatimonadaceae bacterium]|nr:helix-turn-helix domain-containing protein [Gemmatimonadaceae bacterium]
MRIGFLGFDDVQALDLIGPADAFGSDAYDTMLDLSQRPYEVTIIGMQRRTFTASCGVRFTADVGPDTSLNFDTVIVPGGSGLRRTGLGERVAKWIAEREPSTRRIASVCTGIYGLAPSGLLDGRTVTTHWSAAKDVARRFPRLDVHADSLFLKSGKFYTSAGVSAGIDLALALIEEDLGPSASLAVAREMVVYVKRAGGQNQFSEPLEFQSSAADRFKDLAAWIHAHLRDDLSVDALAEKTFLSVRQFARAFKEELGTTPAQFVEDARLAEAQRRLGESRRRISVDAVARSVGYASADVFRRAFERRFGVSPTHYRSRFGAGARS